MRKVIQIITGVTGSPYMNGTKVEHSIYALCDDGTMWKHIGNDWYQLPDIPQDEPKQPATSPDVVAALRELTNVVEEYIQWHDICGDNHGDTFQASKRMRFNKDAARTVLKWIDGQEEPR